MFFRRPKHQAGIHINKACERCGRLLEPKKSYGLFNKSFFSSALKLSCPFCETEYTFIGASAEITQKASLSKCKMKRYLRRLKELEKKGREVAVMIEKNEKQKSPAPETTGNYRDQYEALEKEKKELDAFFQSVQKELTDEIAKKQKEIVPHKYRIKELAIEIRRKEKLLQFAFPKTANKQNRALLTRISAAAILIVIITGAGLLGFQNMRGKGVKPSPPVQKAQSAKNQVQAPGISARESIEVVFDIIRQANIRKNINLYASCFSPAFPSIEERKNKMLNNWKQYDFNKISFMLTEVVIDKDRADVTVDWLIDASSTRSGKKQKVSAKSEVQLRNENGVWRIALLKKEGVGNN